MCMKLHMYKSKLQQLWLNMCLVDQSKGLTGLEIRICGWFLYTETILWHVIVFLGKSSVFDYSLTCALGCVMCVYTPLSRRYKRSSQFSMKYKEHQATFSNAIKRKG